MKTKIKSMHYTDVEEVKPSKKESQQKEISKEKLFKIISEFSADWIYWINPDNTLGYISPSCKYVTGYLAEEILNDQSLIEKLIVPEDLPKFRSHLDEEIKGKVLCTEEFRIITKHGEQKWIAHTCQAVYDDDNVYLGRYVNNRDITKLKDSWCNSCIKDDIYKSISIANYQVYPNGKLKYANDVFLNMLGFEYLENISGKNIEELLILNVDKRAEVKEILDLIGSIKNVESEWIRNDGSIIFVKENMHAVKDKNGDVLYYEGVMQNITDVKKAEISIIEAEDKERRLEKLKAEFLATISHEIRTPLNVVLNLTELLKSDLENNLDSEQLEYAVIMEKESRRIQHTIDLILGMSQLVTGNYDYKPEIFNIYNDILKPIYSNKKSSAEQKGLEFVLTNNVNSSNIVADKYSYSQIFSQLIDNAVKYTNEGKIEVKIYFNNDGKLTVDVMDTGIGIDKKFLPYLFKTFSQEDNSYSRMFEGTGLGLAIVKKYCDLNDAQIEVISAKGEGSTFRVILQSKIVDTGK